MSSRYLLLPAEPKSVGIAYLIHLHWTLLNITVQLCSDSILLVSIRVSGTESKQNGGIPQSFE